MCAHHVHLEVAIFARKRGEAGVTGTRDVKAFVLLASEDSRPCTMHNLSLVADAVEQACVHRFAHCAIMIERVHTSRGHQQQETNIEGK